MSPKLISSVAVASFSFRTGTAPSSNSARRAARTLRYARRSAISAAVSSTCAASRPCACSASFQSACSLAWPSAEAACSCGRPAAGADAGGRAPERDRARRDDADRRPALHGPRDLGGGSSDHLAARLTGGIDDQRRPELDDDGRSSHDAYLRCVPSPTTRNWRSQRSRYVTGPRGPGAKSTLMPVSGAPVSAKPSVKRVGAFQKAAVPR